VNYFCALLLTILVATTTACSGGNETIEDVIEENVSQIDNNSNAASSSDSDSTPASDASNNSSETPDDDGLIASDDNSNSQNSEGECTLTAVQQELLDAHNTARAEARNCGATLFPATTPLVWDCTLADIANDHNVDMGTNNFFNHTGSDGLSSSDRATNAGYNWSAVGENIAAGFSDVASVMQGWLGSEGHCENLMRASYQEMGGNVYSASGSDFPTYWTVNFGTESSF